MGTWRFEGGVFFCLNLVWEVGRRGMVVLFMGWGWRVRCAVNAVWFAPCVGSAGRREGPWRGGSKGDPTQCFCCGAVRPALRCPAGGEGPRGCQQRSAVKLTRMIIPPD